MKGRKNESKFGERNLDPLETLDGIGHVIPSLLCPVLDPDSELSGVPFWYHSPVNLSNVPLPLRDSVVPLDSLYRVWRLSSGPVYWM